jgi:hypothetical protein
MKMRGKRSSIDAARAAVVAATVAVMAVGAVPAEGGKGFLIPGVALSDAVFEVGTWCRYLVVDEIMGAKDSTSVYIAITGRVDRDGSDAWWLELESGPVDAPPAQRDIASALITSAIKNSVPGDSLYQYISLLYVKKGTGPVEPADPASLEQLTLSNPTSDSDWELTTGRSVDTPRGTFSCEHKHLVVKDDREIDMGRVTLVKDDTDVFDVWLCEEVPVFRVAKCVIERVRDSKTVPQVPGIPNKQREESRTTIQLVDFGTDARAKLKIP